MLAADDAHPPRASLPGLRCTRRLGRSQFVLQAPDRELGQPHPSAGIFAFLLALDVQGWYDTAVPSLLQRVAQYSTVFAASVAW